MNPCRKVYTADEDQRIGLGQLALLARWQAAPFSTGQPRGYAVTLGGVVMNGNQVDQEFIVRHATTALTPAWDQELRRMHLQPEHSGAGEFRVHVPHRVHLRARWLPCSMDRGCLSQTALHILVAGCLAWLAYCIGGGE